MLTLKKDTLVKHTNQVTEVHTKVEKVNHIKEANTKTQKQIIDTVNINNQYYCKKYTL